MLLTPKYNVADGQNHPKMMGHWQTRQTHVGGLLTSYFGWKPTEDWDWGRPNLGKVHAATRRSKQLSALPHLSSLHQHPQ